MTRLKHSLVGKKTDIQCCTVNLATSDFHTLSHKSLGGKLASMSLLSVG